jgi:phosphoglycolate phosphatase-like HAD superfamily hydrolase
MSQSVLVLDYDGVILNSIYEKFVVGFNGYLNVRGSSSLMGGEPIALDDFRATIDANPEIMTAFRAMVPMIVDIGENALAFQFIERSEAPLSREEFKALTACVDPKFYARCHDETLRLRRVYGEDHSDAYLELSPVFQTIAQTLGQHRNTLEFYICTTKPEENVRYFNRRFGLETMVKDIYVCGGDRKKVDCLEEIRRFQKSAASQITFVDDFSRHLIPADNAGFSCYYATWGFGGAKDQHLAESAGIELLAEAGLESIISSLSGN